MVKLTKKDGQWWKGEITVSYNLKIVLKLCVALAVLAIIAFILYWIVVGGVALVKTLYGWGCNLWSWSVDNWWWPLGILLAALLAWLLSKINWRSEKTKANIKKWWWILPLVLLLILAALLFRSCGDENSVAPIEKQEIEAVTVEEFDRAFDWVVIARAYLDGVQNAGDKINRALVGLKYVDGKPVSPDDFSGKTYDEAKEIIAKNWRTLVAENLKGVKLSRQQLVTVTLFAMRNGKYGFEKSDFLKALQEGRIADADKLMALHKASGDKRELRTEAQQYLWVLKNLWRGNLKMEELLDFPMFSYKTISLEKMYENRNYEDELRWDAELYHQLKNHQGKTPREALKLN